MSTEIRTRLLAVLFVDQVASTALLQEVGDLEADQLRHRLEPVLDSAILDHAGTIVKKMGDGRMAVFDSATDAINSGIAMHQGCERDNRLHRGAHELRIRVGVSVGDVTEENGDFHGATVVEAARLESAAPHGAMLCTDMAQALVGNRSAGRFDARVDVDAKGFSEPITAWQVGWETAIERPLSSIPAGLGAGGRMEFAGRDTDLAEARAAWSATLDGQLNGLLIGGEPGVGKTRLARELALEALDDGALILYGRCDDGVGVPFQPIAEALTRFIEHEQPGVEELGRFPGELRHLVPDLDRFVEGLPEMIRADSDTEMYRLFDAVLSWLETVAAQRPVLLVVDDIHWAAEPSMGLLRHLFRRTPTARLCIVATYRDTEADASSQLLRFLGESQRSGSEATSIKLTGLDVPGIVELLRDAGIELGSEEEAKVLAGRLRRQTGGNAFFLGELVTLLREGGAESLTESAPEALGQVVLDRISRLSEPTVELLNAAAVASSEVSLDVLVLATGRSRHELIDASEEALGAGLLVEIADAPVRYRFQHDLVRSTLYDTMSLGRRTLRHHQMAHAIEIVHVNDLDGYLDDLAFHYERSTDPDDTDRAVIVVQLAGDHASERLGFATAVKHYRSALTLMDRYGCSHPKSLRGRLMLGLGVMMKRAGIQGARTVLFEAAEVAAAEDDADTIVSAALANTRGFFSSAGRTDERSVELLEMALRKVDGDDAVHTAKLLANLSVELTFGHDRERRMRLSDQSLAMAERLGDPACLAHVINQRIGVLWHAAGLAERLRLCERLDDITHSLGAPQWRYTSASSQFQAAMEAGDLALADRCVDQMCISAEELRQPVVLSYLRMRESVRAIVGGDLVRGEELATECFEIGQAAGQPDALTFYFGQLINLRFHQGRLGELESVVAEQAKANPGLPSLQAALALLYCETGQLDKARVPFEDLVDRHDELLVDLSWLVMTALLADACFQLGDAERAVGLHAVLEPFREQCVDNATNWFGSVGHYLGLLEHTMGRFDQADASFAAAVEWHERMPAPLLLARTRVDWATSLLRRPSPDHESAAPLVASSRDAAREAGLGAVLGRAVELAEVR